MNIQDWREAIEACKRDRARRLKDWQENVQYRIGQPFESAPRVHTVNVPVDWSRTKNKTAQLFFQVPALKATARQAGFEQAARIYAAAVQDVLEHQAKVQVAIDEVLQDVINASGFGVVELGFDGIFEDVEVPAIDLSGRSPEEIQALQAAGQIPTQTVSRAVYTRYTVERVSPAEFLWDTSFKGSDWQRARWLGREGVLPIAEAIRRGWIDASYPREEAARIESLNQELTDQQKAQGPHLRYTRIFYRRADFDTKVADPREIWELVFVDGKDEPVVHEQLKWQEYNPQTRQWIGLTTFPIKVLTLTTVSDTPIPPSDSQIGRPQVRELITSRSQMLRQRDRSMPLRWFDVNLVDEDIVELIRKGEYQDLIPMNGPGSMAIGEVARGTYPRESFEFQRIIEHDLDEAWSMGPNQQGFATPGDTSATEASIMQASAATRIDYERSRVLRFFIEIAEGIGALMQMFQDEAQWVAFEDEAGREAWIQWDKSAIRGDFLFELAPDSAARVDVGQKRAEWLNIYKLLRRDPLINGEQLLRAGLELHGLDATKLLVQPQPPAPPPPTIRYSFSGADLTNPIVVAIVQKHSPAPITPEDLKAALLLMSDAGIPVLPPQALPLPNPETLQGDGANPLPPNPVGRPPAEHPGPVQVVESLDRRYEQGNGSAE